MNKNHILAGAVSLYVFSLVIVIFCFVFPAQDVYGGLIYGLLILLFLGGAIPMTVVYFKMRKDGGAEEPEEDEENSSAAAYSRLKKLQEINNEGGFAGIDVKIANQRELVFVGCFDTGELGIVSGEKIMIYPTMDEINENFDRVYSEEEARDFFIARIERYQSDIENYGRSLKNFMLLKMLWEGYENGFDLWEDYRDFECGYDDESCRQMFEEFYESVIQPRYETLIELYENEGLKAEFEFDLMDLASERLPFFDRCKFFNELSFNQISFDIDWSYSTPMVLLELTFSDRTEKIFNSAFIILNENLTVSEWHNF